MKQNQNISAFLLKVKLRQGRAEKFLNEKLNEELEKALLENQFGCMCLQAQKFDLAEKHLLIAKEKLPTLLQCPVTNVDMNLANLYAQKRETQMALQYYFQVVNESPYSKEENFKEKNSLYVWSSKLNSFEAYVDSHTNLACLLSNLGENDKGYQYCMKAIQLGSEEAHVNFGDLLRQLGRREEAIDHFWKQMENFGYSKPEDKIIDCKKIQPIKNDKVNVICLKWGNKYGPEYVNRLYNGVKRYSQTQLEFYCYTENGEGLDENIKVLKLEEGWTGWWGKCTLLSTELEGRIVYLDLDMVIVGSLDDILNYEGKLGILKTDDLECEKNNKGGYNSSIMVWNTKQLKYVYEVLKEYQEGVHKLIVRFDFWLEIMIRNADMLQDVYPEQICDYLKDCQVEVPQNCKIVCFARKPKPDDYPSEWIKEKWI